MEKWMRCLRKAGVCILLSFIILISLPVEAVAMKAGTAKAVITPEDYLTNHRISVMGISLKGLKHDIYARALVLNDGAKRLVIVTYDLNCLDVATPVLRVRCRDELGIDPAYLVLLATHNHAAPIQIVPDNFDYGLWLADRIFDLIKEAIANERGPVRLLFGTGRADFVMSSGKHGYLYMLLVGNKPVDYDVQLLKVMQEEQVVAMLFNQATHPLHECWKKIGVCHCGYAVEEVEKRMPGALAMYADACGGNQFIKKPLVLWAPVSLVKSVGQELAEIVVEISDGPMDDVTGPISSKLEVISLPLAPPVSYEEALELAKDIPMDIGFVPYPDPDRETNWIRALIQHYEEGIPFPTRTTDRVCTDDAFLVRELDEPREFPCIYEETIVSRIGPMVFVAMQGEVCTPIGIRIKDEFRDEMPVMVFAYMGEHNLYIPTRDIVRRNAYQAQVIQIQYASPVPWAEEVEDEMVDGVIRIIESMIE
jgi:neutral ceramidase